MLTALRKALYIVARALGDILSIKRGKVGTRIGRRAIGRTFGVLMKNLF